MVRVCSARLWCASVARVCSEGREEEAKNKVEQTQLDMGAESSSKSEGQGGALGLREKGFWLGRLSPAWALLS